MPSSNPELLPEDLTPDRLECATCGGTARRVTWGATVAVCYRCRDCHAGGHVCRDDDDRIVRQGGVFTRLENLATRRLTEIQQSAHLTPATDGGFDDRRVTIVETEDGIAVGEDAVPERLPESTEMPSRSSISDAIESAWGDDR